MKEAFVLRTEAAFAAMGAWDARSEAAWAAWRAARAAGAYQTCAGTGMVAPGPTIVELAQHFVLGVFAGPFVTFRWPTKEAFFLRRDAASAAVDAWEARSEAAWAAACQALVGGGGLGSFGCLGSTIGSGW